MKNQLRSNPHGERRCPDYANPLILTQLSDRGSSSFSGFRPFHEFPDNCKKPEHCV